MLEVCEQRLEAFNAYLHEQEYSTATIKKYLRDVRLLARFCGGIVCQKAVLVAFKDDLIKRGYAASSINSMLASVNQFLVFSQKVEWRVRYIKIQKTLFLSKDRELKQSEYMRLIQVAEEHGNKRLSVILQTICVTGIRVSELRAITVESLKSGCAQIWSKGKLRQILIPAKLCQLLKAYCKMKGITAGAVFVTRGGKVLDRSNLWKMMKRLA